MPDIANINNKVHVYVSTLFTLQSYFLYTAPYVHREEVDETPGIDAYMELVDETPDHDANMRNIVCMRYLL